MEANKIIHEVISYVKSKPQEFGIKGENILYKGVPMKDTSVADVVSYVLTPEAFASEPKGTSSLRSQLLADEYIKVRKNI